MHSWGVPQHKDFASCVFHISLLKTGDLCMTGPPYSIWIKASSMARMPPVNIACVISESWRSLPSEVKETEKVLAIYLTSHIGTDFVIATAQLIHMISNIILENEQNRLYTSSLCKHSGRDIPGPLIGRMYPKYLIHFNNNIKWWHVLLNDLHDTEETGYASC